MVTDVRATVNAVVANGGTITQEIGAEAPEIPARFADPSRETSSASISHQPDGICTKPSQFMAKLEPRLSHYEKSTALNHFGPSVKVHGKCSKTGKPSTGLSTPIRRP